MAGEIPHVNWAAYSLLGKYQMMHAGPGSEAVVPAARTLGVLAPEFGASSDNIQAALRGTGVEWQGKAATAFTSTMRRAAQWAQRSSQASKAGADQVQGYGSSYDATRSKIPSPVEIGENSFLGQLADETGGALRDRFGSTFGVQSDYAKRVAAHRAADEVANQALAQHENLTRQAVSSFPDSQPTPPITNPAASATSAGGHGPGGDMDTGGGVGSGGGVGGHGGAAHPGDSAPTASAGWTPVQPPAGTRPGGGLGGGAGSGGAPDAPTPERAGTGLGGGPAPAGPLPTGGGGWRPSASPRPTATWGGSTGGPGYAAGRSGYGAGGSGYRASVPSYRPGGRDPSGYGAGRYGGGGYGASGYGTGGPGYGSGGAGYGGGVPGAGGVRELAARGGPGFAEPSGRPGSGPPGMFAEGGMVGRGAVGMGGMAGMPPMMGGAGVRGQELEHHNNVFIPSDEPFAVDPGDDLVPPVLGEPGALP